jgi:phytoene/squalene synthetase
MPSYAYVRCADEIVDSFLDFDRKQLLEEFRQETFTAIERKISINPVINSFQRAVHEYQIDHYLIETFLDSMEMDLEQCDYDREKFNRYNPRIGRSGGSYVPSRFHRSK